MAFWWSVSTEKKVGRVWARDKKIVVRRIYIYMSWMPQNYWSRSAGSHPARVIPIISMSHICLKMISDFWKKNPSRLTGTDIEFWTDFLTDITIVIEVEDRTHWYHALLKVSSRLSATQRHTPPDGGWSDGGAAAGLLPRHLHLRLSAGQLHRLGPERLPHRPFGAPQDLYPWRHREAPRQPQWVLQSPRQARSAPCRGGGGCRVAFVAWWLWWIFYCVYGVWLVLNYVCNIFLLVNDVCSEWWLWRGAYNVLFVVDFVGKILFVMSTEPNFHLFACV